MSHSLMFVFLPRCGTQDAARPAFLKFSNRSPVKRSRSFSRIFHDAPHREEEGVKRHETPEARVGSSNACAQDVSLSFLFWV